MVTHVIAILYIDGLTCSLAYALFALKRHLLLHSTILLVPCNRLTLILRRYQPLSFLMTLILTFLRLQGIAARRVGRRPIRTLPQHALPQQYGSFLTDVRALSFISDLRHILVRSFLRRVRLLAIRHFAFILSCVRATLVSFAMRLFCSPFGLENHSLRVSQDHLGIRRDPIS